MNRFVQYNSGTYLTERMQLRGTRGYVRVWRGVWSGGLSLLEGVACLVGCGDWGACEGGALQWEIIQLDINHNYSAKFSRGLIFADFVG